MTKFLLEERGFEDKKNLNPTEVQGNFSCSMDIMTMRKDVDAYATGFEGRQDDREVNNNDRSLTPLDKIYLELCEEMGEERGQELEKRRKKESQENGMTCYEFEVLNPAVAPAVTAVVAPGEDAENADDKADEATSDHFDFISPTAAARAKRNADISSSSDADSDNIKGGNGKECAKDLELAGLTSLLEKNISRQRI